MIAARELVVDDDVVVGSAADLDLTDDRHLPVLEHEIGNAFLLLDGLQPLSDRAGVDDRVFLHS
jgi:hypothetical protein